MHSVGRTYTRAIHQAGGTPVILPPLMQRDDWALLLERLDALLLSGGEDIAPAHYGQDKDTWLGGVDEIRDTSELGLVRLWVEQRRPLLAICRGHQVLNIALGGSLYQDIAAYIPDALDHAYVPGHPMEDPVHTVTLEAESHLARLLGGTDFDVNSAHHQAVKTPGEGLRVVGHAPDGVIEAVEMPEHPFCLGVQWHPEAMVKRSDTMRPLFAGLIQAAGG